MKVEFDSNCAQNICSTLNWPANVSYYLLKTQDVGFYIFVEIVPTGDWDRESSMTCSNNIMLKLRSS